MQEFKPSQVSTATFRRSFIVSPTSTKKEFYESRYYLDWVQEKAQRFENSRELIRSGTAKYYNSDIKIPEQFVGKNLANFKGTDEFKENIRKAFRNWNVFVHGSCGTGKTHLACATLLDYYADALTFEQTQTGNPRWARFISCVDLIADAKEEIGKRFSDMHFCRDRIAYDAFVFDDFGATRLTDYSINLLATLIDEMYRKRPSHIFITSNFSVEEISRLIDDRTASRIMGMCRIFELGGADRRITEKENGA